MPLDDLPGSERRSIKIPVHDQVNLEEKVLQVVAPIAAMGGLVTDSVAQFGCVRFVFNVTTDKKRCGCTERVAALEERESVARPLHMQSCGDEESSSSPGKVFFGGGCGGM